MEYKKKRKETLTFNQLFKNPKLRDDLLKKVQDEEIELVIIPAASGRPMISGIFKLIKADIN